MKELLSTVTDQANVNDAQSPANRFFLGGLLLAGLLIAASGCDVLSQQDESSELAGTYAPDPDNNLGFVAIFEPFSFRIPPDTVDLASHPDASLRLTLNNSADTQPGDNLKNDGRVTGHIAIPESLFVSSDSTQIVYGDSLDTDLDYSFNGNYVITIDRLHLQLDQDTTGPARSTLLPGQWDVDEGLLRGSTSRFVRRSGESVDEPGNASGMVRLLFRLREE